MFHGANKRANTADGIWQFSLSNNDWQRMSGTLPSDVYTYEGHCVYWKNGNRLLYIDGYGKAVWEYDLAKQSGFTKVSTNGTPDSHIQMKWALSDWDARRSLWIFKNGSAVAAYNPATRTFSALPDCNVGGSAICYISKWDVYLAVGSSGSQTRVFDIANRTWKSINGGSTGFFVDEQDKNYIRYDETTDRVGMVTAFRNFYTFRYNPGTTGVSKTPRSRGSIVNINPNPFSCRTVISCSLLGNEKIPVRLAVFNLLGKRMKLQKTKTGKLSKGIVLDTPNFPIGTYIVKIDIGHKRMVKNIVVLR
jgi:hypothetical protein